VSEDAFKCPEMDEGGLPATNPKPGQARDGQTSDTRFGGNSNGGDWQVNRIAYTPNGALIARNKFLSTPNVDPGLAPRRNILATPEGVTLPSDTVMATEYYNDWTKIRSASGGGGNPVKSHRPVIGFASRGGDWQFNQHYGVGQNITNPWTYKTNLGVDQPSAFGLIDAEAQKTNASLLNVQSTLNAVGRHHPGRGTRSEMGGLANFSYADGHVERKNVYDSVVERQWGDKYLTITGTQEVSK